MSTGGHRIGEFARRVGVTPELLRAWELRYGLLKPVRTPGGFRLYDEEDAERVARMRRALGDGLSAAEAARVALEASSSPDRPTEDGTARLMSAIEAYDEAAVQAALDDGLAAFGLEAFVRDLILPTLSAVGRGWEQGGVEISQEHFASNLIRGRLLGLARLWARGSGPLALLACAPGEQHDISLLAFGLILRSYGWRILFLGADTPLPTLHQTAITTGPAAIVLVTFDTALVKEEGAALRRLTRIAPLFLSGPGASPDLTGRLRVRRLDGDLIAAAHQVAMMTNELSAPERLLPRCRANVGLARRARWYIRTESRAEDPDPGDAVVGFVVVRLLLDEEGAVRSLTPVPVDDVVPTGDLGGVDAEYIVDVAVAEPGAQHLKGVVARGGLPGAAGRERAELDLWIQQLSELGEVATGDRVGERRAQRGGRGFSS